MGHTVVLVDERGVALKRVDVHNDADVLDVVRMLCASMFRPNIFMYKQLSLNLDAGSQRK
jgi:hypothetical protein